mmetsp:Transcript_51748/g.150258  ORF Transcript_51748/g.150258 Transcript_51748/m.150258 type:complete len:330 (+) Transcript_51748:173-1162(+)
MVARLGRLGFTTAPCAVPGPGATDQAANARSVLLEGGAASSEPLRQRPAHLVCQATGAARWVPSGATRASPVLWAAMAWARASRLRMPVPAARPAPSVVCWAPLRALHAPNAHGVATGLSLLQQTSHPAFRAQLATGAIRRVYPRHSSARHAPQAAGGKRPVPARRPTAHSALLAGGVESVEPLTERSAWNAQRARGVLGRVLWLEVHASPALPERGAQHRGPRTRSHVRTARLARHSHSQACPIQASVSIARLAPTATVLGPVSVPFAREGLGPTRLPRPGAALVLWASGQLLPVLCFRSLAGHAGETCTALAGPPRIWRSNFPASAS